MEIVTQPQGVYLLDATRAGSSAQETLTTWPDHHDCTIRGLSTSQRAFERFSVLEITSTPLLETPAEVGAASAPSTARP